jgi:hypothetical protein
MDINPFIMKDIASTIHELQRSIFLVEILPTFNSNSYTYISPSRSSPGISIEQPREHDPLTSGSEELFTMSIQNNSDDGDDGDPEEDEDIDSDDDDEYDEDDDKSGKDGSSTGDSDDEDEFDEEDGDEDKALPGDGNGIEEQDDLESDEAIDEEEDESDADDHGADEDFEDDEDLDEEEYGSDWEDDDDEDDFDDDDDELKPLNSSINRTLAQFSPSSSLESRTTRSSLADSSQTGQGQGQIDFDIT